MGPIVVCAEYWPSWSFALDVLGCTDISTYTRFSSPLAKKEFQATGLGKTLKVNIQSLILELRDKAVPPLIFLQGSDKFAKEMKATLSQFQDATFTSVTNLSNIEKEEGSLGNLVSHVASGGITDGRWTYQSDAELHQLDKSVRRSLGLVLRPLNTGIALSHLGHSSTTNERVYEEDSIVEFGSTFVRVNAPCVFVKDEKVRRKLSIEEVYDIYDLDRVTQQELSLFQAAIHAKPSLAFTKQVPVKVLVRLGKAVMQGIWSPDHSHRGAIKDKAESEVKPGTPSSLNHPIHGGDNNVYEETTIGDIINGNSCEEIDVSLNNKENVKAAKNDDAKANENDWNLWCVDNFDTQVLKHGSEPVVCTKGSYSPHHGRLLDALRVLAHRRYRRNLVKSLLRHLHQEHSSGEKVVETVTWFDPNKGLEVKSSFKVSKWTKTLNSEERKKGKRSSKGRKGDKWEVENLYKDWKVGSDAVRRGVNSTWWEWSDGSTLKFWRWPRCYMAAVRDGTKLFVDHNKLPRYRKPQIVTQDPTARQQVEKKINKVRQRRYIEQGLVKSVTAFFDVPKGDNDIRMVYDATKCGLNEALWTPNFFIPTIDTILRNADDNTWFGDIDLGEMFLNYWINDELRPYVGVDVTNMGERSEDKYGNVTFISEDKNGKIWERWERTLMGFQSSPYICTQMFSWSEDCLKGDRKDPTNPLKWDDVCLNLPGASGYDPGRPWVYKYDRESGQLASFLGTYIDDIRTGAASEAACRATSRRVASWTNYFGQQDAPRKRRPPSTKPGAWSGAMVRSTKGVGLFVTCSEEKWLKGKAIVKELYDKVVVKEVENLSYKSLEKGVGFLVYLSRTFPVIFPYLRCVYNMMNGWRKDCNKEGWKMTSTEWQRFLEEEMEFEGNLKAFYKGRGNVGKEGKTNKRIGKRKRGKDKRDVPDWVTPVPAMKKDLEALMKIFETATPPDRLIRGKSINVVKYGFGDASKAGFGASWEGKSGIRYRYGVWGADMDDESSNLREFTNLVETFEEMEKEGELDGVEIFMFTDNSTTEAAFFNWSSSSKKLFDLVLRLRLLEIKSRAKIHLVHISGKRMIMEGADGLSRGDFSEGVMRGEAMSNFIPLAESALDRSKTLKGWILAWAGDDIEFLEPRDWFLRGHDIVDGRFEINCDGFKLPTFKPGKFVWSPPPAAAEACLEELRKARHKRSDSSHIVVIPRVLSPYWKKHLHRVADLVIDIPCGHEAWPIHMLEPLTFAIILPLAKHRPWQLKRTPAMLGMERLLRKLWKDHKISDWPVLLEFWSKASRIASMQKDMVWKLLRSQQGFIFSNSNTRKRRGSSLDETRQRKKICRSEAG